MKRQSSKILYFALGLLLAFLLWTLGVRAIDVQQIGPRGSWVGFAVLNAWFHSLTGTHMALYTVTDWLGLVPVALCLGFAALGLVQMIRRKSLFKVDPDILALGGFYILVFSAYIFFEMFAVNYRPVLIEGRLEASYPSSTTLMTLCVIPAAIMQLRRRSSKRLSAPICGALWIFAAFMVVGRLISGVHWLSDIAGGVLLAGGLVLLYYASLLRLCGEAEG